LTGRPTPFTNPIRIAEAVFLLEHGQRDRHTHKLTDASAVVSRRHSPRPTVGKHDVIHQTGNKLHIATPAGENLATVTDDMTENLVMWFLRYARA